MLSLCSALPPVRFVAAAAAAMLLLTLGPAAAPASAEPTEVRFHAISQGAKFIGTSMGGVRITVRDAQSDELLATGVTRGGTGETHKIMHAAPRQGEPMATEGAAHYTATFDLAEPRLVEATAYGPLAQRQSATEVSETRWLIPGKDMTDGDGWLIELPGLAVDVLSPPSASGASISEGPVRVRANVTMLCGCPITPGGIWDAETFRVRAIVQRNGETVRTVPLRYAGEASQFETRLSIEKPGTYELLVYARRPSTNNTGLDRTTFKAK